ncbi:hypothetical protein ASL14_25645 (plasmid) [Paenibacillus sp. IHB B 3084]|nr:hypothetical protein ASL14_25645 [Paenibacillus sp. IHB B 3084]
MLIKNIFFPAMIWEMNAAIFHPIPKYTFKVCIESIQDIDSSENHFLMTHLGEAFYGKVIKQRKRHEQVYQWERDQYLTLN